MKADCPKRSSVSADRPVGLALSRSFRNQLQGVLVWTACLSLLTPRPVAWGQQAETAVDPIRDPTEFTSDLELSGDQALRGQVVNLLGEPQPDCQVEFQAVNGGRVHAAHSDEEGNFCIGPLSGGSYAVRCQGSSQVIRLWAPGTAPPQARRELQVLATQPLVIRGQQPFPNLFCNEPLLIGVLVAAAIAIPLAVHSSDDRPPGS